MKKSFRRELNRAGALLTAVTVLLTVAPVTGFAEGTEGTVREITAEAANYAAEEMEETDGGNIELAIEASVDFQADESRGGISDEDQDLNVSGSDAVNETDTDKVEVVSETGSEEADNNESALLDAESKDTAASSDIVAENSTDTEENEATAETAEEDREEPYSGEKQESGAASTEKADMDNELTQNEELSLKLTDIISMSKDNVLEGKIAVKLDKEAEKTGPESVSFELAYKLQGKRLFKLGFSAEDRDWFRAIKAISVDGTSYKKDSWVNTFPSWKSWYNQEGYNGYNIYVTNDLDADTLFMVSAEGYEDVLIKLTKKSDTDYEAEIVYEEEEELAPEEEEDNYTLHVKIEGSFEAAIKGQTDYDAVSSATGSATISKNSDVTVYVARTEKDKDGKPEWSPMGLDNKNGVNIQRVDVQIVPNTEKGTPKDADSGMSDAVNTTLGSSISLAGTPNDPGYYSVYVSVTDDAGRTAESNSLPFRVYSGEETLEEQLAFMGTEEGKVFEHTSHDDKYMWKYMEPWRIKNFGSNVDGESESIRVPNKLKLWAGSGGNGPYANLGYPIDWVEVEDRNIPQTLYIPKGTSLTMQNMKIHSSVRIVIEEGGRLELRRSTVEGRIDVCSGGVFSMNYANGSFTSGSILNGLLYLTDGAIVENSAIISHANYLADGDKTDRRLTEPVVIAAGDVKIIGKVFIKGDEAYAADGEGQKALRVIGGKLMLEDDAVLGVFGGAGKVALYAKGGTALELRNGAEIAGNGKLIAVGGKPQFGIGGNAVAGAGIISTAEAVLQGSTASDVKGIPGYAVYPEGGNIRLTSPKYHVANGSIVNVTMISDWNDPLGEDYYWNTAKTAAPKLSLYKTTKTQTVEDEDKPQTDDEIHKEESQPDDELKSYDGELQGNEEVNTDEEAHQNDEIKTDDDSSHQDEDSIKVNDTEVNQDKKLQHDEESNKPDDPKANEEARQGYTESDADNESLHQDKDTSEAKTDENTSLKPDKGTNVGTSGRGSGSAGSYRPVRSVKISGSVLGAERMQDSFAGAVWQKTDKNWFLKRIDGEFARGWALDKGIWYYLREGDGIMLTGWQLINDKWYYLSESGALLLGTVTPDGYTVDASGAWTGR